MIVAWALGLFLTAGEVWAQAAAPLLAEAEAAEKAGDAFKAVELYKKASAAEPNRTDIYLKLGAAAEKADLLDVSAQSFNDALSVDPACPGARSSLARVLLKANKPGDADAQARTALETEKDVKPGPMHRIIAQANLMLGNLDAAVLAAAQAYKLEPTPDNGLLLGSAYLEKRDFGPAERYLSWAARNKTDAVAAGKARELLKILETRKAAPPPAPAQQQPGAPPKKSLAPGEVNPETHAELVYTQGVAAYDDGKYEEALTKFRSVAAVKVVSANARMYEGLTLMKLGQYDQAIASLENAISIEPQNVFIRTALGTAFMKLKQYDRAREQYSNALNTNDEGHRGRVHLLIGQLDLQQNLLDSALENLNAAEKANSDLTGEVSYFRGVVLFKRGDKNQARSEFEKVLAEEDGSSPYFVSAQKYLTSGALGGGKEVPWLNALAMFGVQADSNVSLAPDSFLDPTSGNQRPLELSGNQATRFLLFGALAARPIFTGNWMWQLDGSFFLSFHDTRRSKQFDVSSFSVGTDLVYGAKSWRLGGEYNLDLAFISGNPDRFNGRLNRFATINRFGPRFSLVHSPSLETELNYDFLFENFAPEFSNPTGSAADERSNFGQRFTAMLHWFFMKGSGRLTSEFRTRWELADGFNYKVLAPSLAAQLFVPIVWKLYARPETRLEYVNYYENALDRQEFRFDATARLGLDLWQYFGVETGVSYLGNFASVNANLPAPPNFSFDRWNFQVNLIGRY
ncbi:MAG: hypothetical protein GMKNLPBB_01635 [Myxococcota bacterium]|nr:hypothetical protein [Myxococcota bacterium]